MKLQGRWILASVLVLATFGVTAQEAKLSLPVQDPRTGEPVQVRPGAKALHVVFFATWCPPCMEELERLANREDRWQERGYRLVLIAVQNRQTAEGLTRFSQSRSVPGELWFDADGRAQRLLDAGLLPTHVVFDAQGREVARAGALNDEIDSAIAELLPSSRR